MPLEKLERSVNDHSPALIVISGRPGTGKSVTAAGVAYLTSRAGGRVLWVDPLSTSREYCPWDGLNLIEDWHLVEPFLVSDLVEKARGRALVVLDHVHLEAKELVAQATKLAQQAEVRVLVTVSEKPERRYRPVDK